MGRTRESEKERLRAYYIAHRDEMREQARLYYQEHKEALKAASRQRHWSQRAKILQKKNAYYQQNKAKILESQKRYYWANRERIRAASKQWPSMIKTGNGVIPYRKARQALLNEFGGRCVRCGETNYVVLQVDHVFGGGVKEIRRFNHMGGLKDYYALIRANPSRYQILCANCNWIKRYQDSEQRQAQRWADARPCDRRKGEKRRAAYRFVRMRVIEAMGGKCVKCGFTDWRALQIDHVNGNGTHERLMIQKSPRETIEFYKQLTEQPSDGYQLLCANCNWCKRAERHEFRTAPKEAIKEVMG